MRPSLQGPCCGHLPHARWGTRCGGCRYGATLERRDAGQITAADSGTQTLARPHRARGAQTEGLPHADKECQVPHAGLGA